MKIGILTASRTDNIGTDLQAYAMQKICSNVFSEAELINYVCQKLENSRKAFYPHTLKGFLSIPYKLVNHFHHEAFRKKYFNYSDKEYCKDDLKEMDYDLVVVGSDQIWNLDITGKDLGFFLPDKKTNYKKCSYAASLGRTDIRDWEAKYQLSSYLQQFDYLSVRERSGVIALKQIGIAAQDVLDPLLLLPTKYWEDIAEQPRTSRKYIVIYVVDRTQEAIDFARKYAKKNRLDIYYVGNPLKPITGLKIKRFISIQEWIGYIKNAELIVTNSYHGMAICISFHKDVACFKLSNKESNSRLENAFRYFGVDSIEDGRIYSPDWNSVEHRLSQARTEGIKYLTRIKECSSCLAD